MVGDSRKSELQNESQEGSSEDQPDPEVLAWAEEQKERREQEGSSPAMPVTPALPRASLKRAPLKKEPSRKDFAREWYFTHVESREKVRARRARQARGEHTDSVFFWDSRPLVSF